MLTVVIGLTSALVYGSADFLGGLASRRMGAVLTTATVATVGLGVLLLGMLFIGGTWSWPAVLLGALSGLSGAIAIGLLYACLAIGPMSILSPLTAVVSAIVPVTVGLLGGERLGTVGYVALGLALVAVILVGFVPEKGAVRPSLKGVLMAVGSGTSLVLAGWLLARRRRAAAADPARGAWHAGLGFVVACGILDALANVGLLLGVRIGELTVIAVLTALYPAGTIILAAVVLKERIAPVQYVGLGLAIVAGGMLALA